ncbi:hypothetical protein [Sinomicrobium sp. M5D2P9]
MKKILLLLLLAPLLSIGQTNTFPASGNVGIGIAAPEGKLDVGGFTYLRGAPGHSTISEQLRIGRRDRDIRYHSIYSNHTSSPSANYLQIRVHAGGDSDLAGQVSVMTLNGAGNVGIGTGAPGDWRLAVKGKIRAEEIKVDTGWSDFVFDKEYNLPTLSEVEAHIKEKGHLKDIPSAKEVEENGVFLGEMDSKLLQKIEELTLYTIQQQKIINSQGKMIEELKGEMEKMKKY